MSFQKYIICIIIGLTVEGGILKINASNWKTIVKLVIVVSDKLQYKITEIFKESS